MEPCKNGGFCLTTDDIPSCTCSFGYTGVYCETEINECETNPCQNGKRILNFQRRFLEKKKFSLNASGGTCIDMIGLYKCQCRGTGFDGKNCENDIDECVVNNIKCGDRGYCVNTPGSFR